MWFRSPNIGLINSKLLIIFDGKRIDARERQIYLFEELDPGRVHRETLCHELVCLPVLPPLDVGHRGDGLHLTSVVVALVGPA